MINMINIEFEVKRIIKQDRDTRFVIARVDITEHPGDVKIPTSETIVQGHFNHKINPKDNFKATGSWQDKGANGHQFIIEQATVTIPESEKGLIEFIDRNTKGTGKQTIGKLVDAFKMGTLNVIRDNPEKLKELKIKGLSDKKIEALRVQISPLIADYELLYAQLLPLGFSGLEIAGINTELGSFAVENIREDPYIVQKLGIATFKKCDGVAEKLGINSISELRVRKLVTEYITYNLRNKGNLYVLKEILKEEINKFTKENGNYKKNENITELHIESALKYLTEKGEITIVKNKDNKKCVYSSFYLNIENRIVNNLTRKIKQNEGILDVLTAMAYVLKKEKEGATLTKEQMDAVITATTSNISILSGGPGVGKTFTLNTIVKCIQESNPDAIIELTAPTGKAAKRMAEVINLPAQTIHRLIGLNNLDEEQELKEIEADFVIVDEASMMDAYLFDSLLRCLPETTKLLIVGDYQQLPSVGPGLILRDLIHSKIIKTSILTEIFRQAEGSQIIQNAHKIIAGDKDLSLDKEKGDFYFIKQQDKEKIRTGILNLMDRLLKTGFKMDEIQVLTPKNDGDLGVEGLNKEIQDRFNKEKINQEEIKVGKRRVFRVGDKVIQTENNYDIKVFNGETGIITKVTNGKIRELVVDFGDKQVSYIAETIAELKLAYAITIHKSQGSEFRAVIVPFHHSLEYPLNKNTIYTATTRASERMIFIGDKEVFDTTINKIDNIQRNSQIKDKLIEQNKKETITNTNKAVNNDIPF